MPLKLTLHSGERMIIGTAVVRNDGETAHLTLENSVPVLRAKNVLSEAEANTPCKRIYLNIQLMYVDEGNLEGYLRTHWQLTHDVATAAPSTLAIIEEVNTLLLRREYYRALKTTQRLIDYEAELMGSAAPGDRDSERP